MKYVRFLCFVCLAFLVNANAQSPAIKGVCHFSGRNGTYEGVIKDRFGPTTIYYRIYFLNDSIFAFTNFTDLDLSQYLKNNRPGAFNYAIFEGIGRLINHNGKKEWWGTRNELTDNEMLNGIHLDLRINPNFLFHMLNTPRPRKGYGSIAVILFKFSENKMAVSPSRALSGAEQGLIDVSLRKIDNTPLDFTIDKKHYNKSDFANDPFVDYVAQVKKNTYLQSIPIPEKIPANKKTGQLEKDEEVYLLRVYIDYIFVARYNTQKEVIKYGWIPRNALYNLKVIRKIRNPYWQYSISSLDS